MPCCTILTNTSSFIAYSFVELMKYLFTVPGVEVFFSCHICQDPLEKFFGNQRQIGGTHDNTTVYDFQKNTQPLRVVNSFCRGTVKGNCRGNDELQQMDSQSYHHDHPSPTHQQIHVQKKTIQTK